MRPESVSTREELGRALTELRVQAGLSVRDVAADADALLGTVAGWFAGQHAPTRASRAMFTRVLGVCGVTESDDVARWWEAVERSARRTGRRRTRPESPYRGFAAFGPADNQLFFGRDDLVARLVDLIGATRSPDREANDMARGVMVVGMSGVGKSSLVRAGLLAQVTHEGPLAGWRHAVMTPGDDALAALDAAMNELDADEHPERPALLIIDQLEEMWTQNSDDARKLAITRILDAATAPGSDVVPVGVLRADFYGRVVPWVPKTLENAQLVVPPMQRDQLREIIVGPARVSDVEVEPELVEMLLDDAVPAAGSTAAGDLPLLSYALLATWEQSDGRRMTVRDYLATGRIGGAVEQAAEKVYRELTPDEQQIARRMLLAMVNVDEDAVTRRRVPLDELTVDGDDRAAHVLENYAASRLVTVSSSHAQVTHEALLTAWPRLREWIDDDREQLLLRRRLRAYSEPWDADGRPDDMLIGGSRLEVFDQLAQGAGDDPIDPVSREFLNSANARRAALVDRERRRSAQLRRVALFAAVFAVVALLAAVFAVVAGVNAIHQREDAEDARNEALSRQLAVQSADLGTRDPFMSAQLAMVAYESSPTLEARSRLIDATGRGVPVRYLGDPGSVLMSRAGSLIAAAGAGGQVRLFRVDDGGIASRIADFRAPGGGGRLAGVALMPDARTLLLGGRGTITAWNIADPARPTRQYDFPEVSGDINRITVSPDGRMVIASVPDAGVAAWVAADGTWRRIPLPPKVAGVAGAAAFSPDGKSLATSSANRRIDLWRVDGDALVPTGEIPLDQWRDNELAQGLVYSPDGSRLLAGLRSRVIDEFDVADPGAPRSVARFTGFNSYVNAVGLSTDGTKVVGAGADNTIRVFDRSDPAAAPQVMTGSSNAVSVMFAGDHVVASSEDGRVQDWPPVRGMSSVGTNSVYQIPANRDATAIVAADTGTDGRITQWRVERDGLVRSGPDLVPAPGTVYSGAVVMTPSGRVVTTGTVTGTVQFADYSDPQKPHVVGSVAAQPTLNETVDYSERSGLAVTGATDGNNLTVIDASTLSAPRVVSRFDAGGGIAWASLSPDGRTAAVATVTGPVRLLDLSNPAAPRAYPDPIAFKASALSVRFDPAGSRLVATSEERNVEVVDISDKEHPRRTAELSGPAGQLYSAGFSADGTRVIAGGSNSEVWVWDLTDGAADVVLRSYPGRVYDVRFLPDDRILAAGQGGFMESWNLGPDRIIDGLCAQGGDPITADEWRTYVHGIDYRSPCRE
ncbi:AAA family ATPase [Gordonia otitidis]|uniref:NACHT and WD repeat domain-containing protein n=1 Tax=Gordonia otitidis TaxID=249058 RepID=UPI001D149CE7|nr:AAA family ATPase [Gordonia otitidis]UEA58036.1 AAA family ATPase [Gordonia otitidis]